jgi:hypothetical protein
VSLRSGSKSFWFGKKPISWFYYLILAVDLQYGPCDGLHKQGAEVASLLGAYTHAIETTLSTRP